MKDIVIASNNANKIKEIKQLIGEYFDKIYSLDELSIDIEIEENGQTFYDNALIKAKTIASLTNMIVLADDSGLMVDALGGRPGVYSARYAGDSCDDKNNIALLLKELDQKTCRKAKFVCCIVVYLPDGTIIVSEGITEGEITKQELGTNGFGYDPVFFSYDLKKSFGQVTDQEKNRISHRSRALQGIKKKLSSLDLSYKQK